MLHTIANSDHHYAIYTLGFYIVFSAYYIVDSLLLKISPKYLALDNEKRTYVVSNIIKSLLLGSITPIAGTILYQTMHLDQWNNNLIKNIGILYAIPDGVSLALVNKMHMTTKIHHIIV